MRVKQRPPNCTRDWQVSVFICFSAFFTAIRWASPTLMSFSRTKSIWSEPFDFFVILRTEPSFEGVSLGASASIALVLLVHPLLSLVVKLS